jgi:predicted nucleotidyltransferase
MALLYFDDLCKKAKLFSSAYATVINAHDFTSNKIHTAKEILQKQLAEVPFKNDYCILSVGSYGRYEASPESDLDIYIIHKKQVSNVTLSNAYKRIKEMAKTADIKLSKGFEPIPLETLQENIGGKKDTNSSITNRILFLLESECLYGRSFYSFAYKKILEKYLRDILQFKKQTPRFLLSDIIRYYRTICVDYEFKITEQNKDWAIRNIKLRFSRKGLYFGGIAILLNSMNKKNNERYEYIAQNLRIPFADKISHILLEQNIEQTHANIISLYAKFLEKISKGDVRAHLRKIRREDRKKDKIFRSLDECSRKFNASLRDLLNCCNWGGKNYVDFLIL